MKSNNAKIFSTLFLLAILPFVAMQASAQLQVNATGGGMPGGKKHGAAMFIPNCGVFSPPDGYVSLFDGPAKTDGDPNASAQRLTGIKTAPRLAPVAMAVWQVVRKDVVRVCVRGGVVNTGAATIAAPITLTLVDDRGTDEADTSANSSGIVPHKTILFTPKIISAALPSNGRSLAADAWCQEIEWKKRPHLLLSISVPAVGQQLKLEGVCQVKFDGALSNLANLQSALN